MKGQLALAASAGIIPSLSSNKDNGPYFVSGKKTLDTPFDRK
jgi:hypothetical protein